MRNMSFACTTTQIINKSKTVTRRIGWRKLKSGDFVMAVRKCMGLQKGEKVAKLMRIKIVGVSREILNTITQEECIKEGFPDLSPSQFIDMFCKMNRCLPDTEVTRIEFSYDGGLKDYGDSI